MNLLPRFWRLGGTKVFFHSIWVQWGPWNDRPKRFETRFLTQARRPWYDGRGLGVRLGGSMLSVGICAPRGLIGSMSGEIHYQPEIDYADFQLQRFGARSMHSKAAKPTGYEQIVSPRWWAAHQRRQEAAKKAAAEAVDA